MELILSPPKNLACVSIVEIDVVPFPPPPAKVIVGAEVYPEPLLLISTDVTVPLFMFAIAVAPDPTPPVITTVGGLVYPVPPLTIFIP